METVKDCIFHHIQIPFPKFIMSSDSVGVKSKGELYINIGLESDLSPYLYLSNPQPQEMQPQMGRNQGLQITSCQQVFTTSLVLSLCILGFGIMAVSFALNNVLRKSFIF